MTYRQRTLGDELRESDGTAPGEAAPRWPDAPEPVIDDEGTVTNAAAECSTCGAASTLVYRCSECGADLASEQAGAGTGSTTNGRP
jgi:hypothetical protein